MNLDPNFMLQLMQVVVFVAQAAMAWYFISGQSNRTTTQISPDPLQVQERPHPASMAELRRLETRVERLEDKFSERFDDIMAAGEERAKRINERIDALMAGVSDLRQEVGELSGGVRRIGERL